jgi:hypothetical protein
MFDAFALISLILCVASVALWIRSWHKGQSVERVDPDRRLMVTSMYGLIYAVRWDGAFQPPGSPVFQPNRAPSQAWQKWMYWHGREFGDTGPAVWAYPPSCGDDQWWQRLGFDWYDLQRKPVPRAIALHDWLQPWWSGRERGLTLPHWVIVLLFSVLPTIALIRLLRLGWAQKRGHSGHSDL